MGFVEGISLKRIELRHPDNPLVYLDVKVGEENVGRVVIELFKHAVPLTTENFRALCTGEQGLGENGKPLHYKGSLFHKIMSHFMVQGGDIDNFDGTSGFSIYGTAFQLENFTVNHDEPGILSMVPFKESYCNSQFIITVTECPHLDSRSVAFGRVLFGFSCVKQICDVKVNSDKPQVSCMISDCGELKPGQDLGLADEDGSKDEYPHGPQDLQIDYKLANTYSTLFQVVDVILESAKDHHRAGRFMDADRKFRKAVRYMDWIKIEAPNLPSYSSQHVSSYLDSHRHFTNLNLSSTSLLLGNFKNCIKFSNWVLDKTADNHKALYRKGRALAALNEYDQAVQVLQKAAALNPTEPSIAKELNSAKQLQANYLAEEKKTYSKMFR